MYQERLSQQYCRQKIDNQINARLQDSVFRSRSPVRDYQYTRVNPLSSTGNGFYSTTSSLSSSTRSVGNLPLWKSYTDEQWKQYESESASKQVRKSIAEQLRLEEERINRRFRKNEIISKINDLNDKFNQQSYSLSYSSIGSSYKTRPNHTIQQSFDQAAYPRKASEQQVLRTQGSGSTSIVSETKKSQQLPQRDDIIAGGSEQNEEVDALKREIEQLRKSEKEHKETAAKLQEELTKVESETAKKVDAAVKKEQGNSRSTVEAEKKKAEILTVRCNQLEDALNNQATEMKESLQTLKSNYETQMKQFSAIVNSPEFQEKKINKAEKDEEEDEEEGEEDEFDEEDKILLRAIKENPELLEIMHEKLLGKQEELESGVPAKKEGEEFAAKDIQLLLQRIAQLEQLLERKDLMTKELIKNSQMKDLEISKMEELLDKFKALYGHVNQEKDLVLAENERLTGELDQFKEYFSRVFQGLPGAEILGGEGEDENQEIQEGDEEDEEDNQAGQQEEDDQDTEGQYQQGDDDEEEGEEDDHEGLQNGEEIDDGEQQ